MKLYFYELCKLFCKRIVWFCVLGLFVANAALYAAHCLTDDLYNIQIKQQVAEVEAEYMDADYAAVHEEIDRLAGELEALGRYILLTERWADDESMQEHYASVCEDIFTEYPDLLTKYAESPYMADPDARNAHLQRLNIVRGQLAYINGYNDFILGVQKRADQMASVSIFSDPGSFSYKNIQRTPQDFMPLYGLELKLGREDGIVSATTFRLTDLFLPVMLFLFCIFLFLHEHDTGLDKLVKTASRGRYPTIIARLGTLASLAVVLTLLFYGTILLMGSIFYGYGDLSRYVQSLPSFQDCTIQMTVGQYLGVYLLTKVGAALLTALLMALAFIVFGEGKSVFTILALFAAVSFVCYQFIHAASWLNLLKYVNIFSAWDVHAFYRLYININFFTVPLNRILLCGTAGILVFIAAFGISAFAYANHVSIHFVDRALAIISRKIRRYTDLRPLKGSASVAAHEWRKLLLTGRAVWILLAALIIAVNLWDTAPLMMGSIDDATYKLYANHWSGDLTEESIREIEAENAYLLSIPDQMKALTMQMRAGLLEEGDYYRAYETLRNYSEQRSKGFDELYTQYARVKALRGGIRPAIVDRLSSNFYFDNEPRDLLMGLLLVLLIVLALGRAFPLDEEKGLSPILRCTAGGRRELTLSKLTASLVCALVLWFLTFLPTMATLLVKYNLSFTSDLQNIDLYANSTLMVSIGTFVVLMEALRLLGAVTAAVWVLYITKSVKKLSMGIILSASVLGLPFLLMFLELGFMRWLGLAAAFTPYQAALAPAWQLGVYAALLAALCALGIWLLIRERSVKR